jgi:hypothetical protein
MSVRQQPHPPYHKLVFGFHCESEKSLYNLPRAVVVHLVNASSNIAAMMCSVWLPVGAFTTPLWTSILGADKYILRIKQLQTRGVRIVIPGYFGF